MALCGVWFLAQGHFDTPGQDERDLNLRGQSLYLCSICPSREPNTEADQTPRKILQFQKLFIMGRCSPKQTDRTEKTGQRKAACSSEYVSEEAPTASSSFALIQQTLNFFRLTLLISSFPSLGCLFGLHTDRTSSADLSAQTGSSFRDHS